MAERRMFAKTIVLSDSFLDMPMSARCLYFTLGMFADDDGFVNSPKSIMRQCGASVDDMNILIGKKFVILFEDGVIVIKHWRINNYLRSDRYVETKYKEDKALLELDENEAYTIGIPVGIPPGIPSIGKDRLGKDSIDKDRLDYNPPVSKDTVPPKGVSKFVPPTVEEVADYCVERGNSVDPEAFVAWYESNGWKVGKNPMKSWKAAVITWEKNPKQDRKPKSVIDSIMSLKQTDDPFKGTRWENV